MKINLLRAFTMLLACLCLSSLHAQDAPKREVGIQLYGLNFNGNNSFSGFYKKQLRENTYRRLQFFAGRISSNFSEDASEANIYLAAAIGREKRKSLDPHLEFYRGPQFGISTSFQSVDERTAVNVFGDIGYVLGLQHSFNDRWAIQIETVPTVSLGVSFAEDSPTTGLVQANISNSVALGVARKF